jgi:flagellar basal-body rod modification protein FlgD
MFMSSVSSINSSSTLSPTENKRGMLGKDDFLKILITQLQHQDPMQPLQDREFIAQMAQFSTVEQISNMARYQKLTYESLAGLGSSFGFLSGIIGKEVEWTDASGSNKTGVVDAIRLKQGVAFAEVEGQELSLDHIIRIGIQN